jgi:hypothetical protein
MGKPPAGLCRNWSTWQAPAWHKVGGEGRNGLQIAVYSALFSIDHGPTSEHVRLFGLSYFWMIVIPFKKKGEANRHTKG